MSDANPAPRPSRFTEEQEAALRAFFLRELKRILDDLIAPADEFLKRIGFTARVLAEKRDRASGAI
ncbi:MAG: hypothetical protein ACRDQZ_00305 [Mycobacteriales bacterium]